MTDDFYAFIDASNLFYGGVKSLGWKIDYRKLLQYLKNKYNISKVFYFAGVETHDFPYSVLSDKNIKLNDLLAFLIDKEDSVNIKRVKFYRKLEEFEYILRIKPTKIYREKNGLTKKKANCDVDMTFEMMKLINEYSGAIVLSGDGDFAVLINYLIEKGKTIIILSRAERTAKEIRQIARGNFRDFHKIRHKIEFFDNKKKGPAKDPSYV